MVNKDKKFYDWYESVKKDFSLSQKIVLLNDNDEVLLVKASADNKWDLPGGHFEKSDKSLIESLKREVSEEIGANVQYDILYEVAIDLRTYKGKIKNIKISYLGNYITGNVILSEEHNEFKWMSFEDAKKNTECKEWLQGVLIKTRKRIS